MDGAGSEASARYLKPNRSGFAGDRIVERPVINTIDAAHGFFTEGILDEEDFSGWREYGCLSLGGTSLNVIGES